MTWALSCGVDLGDDVVDADRGRDLFGVTTVVAGEHGDLKALGAERSDGVG